MEQEKIIKRIVAEGKSLTHNERTRALDGQDRLYLNEKIKHHARRTYIARLALFLLYFDIILSGVAFFRYEQLNDVSRWWIKGLIIVLFVLSLLGLATLSKNHGRNASVLRLVRDLGQHVEGENTAPTTEKSDEAAKE